MPCLDGQIKGEPFRSAPPVATLKLNRGTFFALLVKIAFGLHLSRLRECHRRRLELLLLFFFGSISFGLFLPDRKSTRLNSSHRCISYAVFCLKKKKNINIKYII